ncbi:hypothetical protein DB346_12160 [Verrucomicrobia bacterium LW23]|nr:hypothetical protein DB346_12160 [Verrucomicrobia bacterium LW23]
MTSPTPTQAPATPGQRLVYRFRAFRVPSPDTAEDKTQDAYVVAQRGAGPSAATPGEATVRACVADGSGSSFVPWIWAQALADKFLEAGPPPPTGTQPGGTTRVVTARDWAEWLEVPQQRWKAGIDALQQSLRAAGSNLSWVYNNNIMERRPAASTLVAVEFFEAPQPRWEATIVGDSCMFVLRQQKLTSHPAMSAAEFGKFTQALRSYPVENLSKLPEAVPVHGDVQPGDLFLLATDALAKWIATCWEERTEMHGKAWNSLLAITQQADFVDFVQRYRGPKSPIVLDDDDTTMVIVQVDAAPPDAPSPAAAGALVLTSSPAPASLRWGTAPRTAHASGAAAIPPRPAAAHAPVPQPRPGAPGHASGPISLANAASAPLPTATALAASLRTTQGKAAAAPPANARNAAPEADSDDDAIDAAPPQAASPSTATGWRYWLAGGIVAACLAMLAMAALLGWSLMGKMAVGNELEKLRKEKSEADERLAEQTLKHRQEAEDRLREREREAAAAEERRQAQQQTRSSAPQPQPAPPVTQSKTLKLPDLMRMGAQERIRQTAGKDAGAVTMELEVKGEQQRRQIVITATGNDGNSKIVWEINDVNPPAPTSAQPAHAQADSPAPASATPASPSNSGAPVTTPASAPSTSSTSPADSESPRTSSDAPAASAPTAQPTQPTTRSGSSATPAQPADTPRNRLRNILPRAPGGRPAVPIRAPHTPASPHYESGPTRADKPSYATLYKQQRDKNLREGASKSGQGPRVTEGTWSRSERLYAADQLPQPRVKMMTEHYWEEWTSAD